MQQYLRMSYRVPRRPSVAAIAWLFAGALLGPVRPVLAQGPNAEAQEDRWAAAAEFTLTAADGNQDVTVLATGFRIRHLRRELFEFELKLQARYGSSQGERVIENYQGTFNLDIGPGHRWSPFIYSTAEHDPFKRLDVRVNSGAGAKYRVYRSEGRGEASLSVAMLHSYEELTAAAMPANGAVTQSARWSARLTGQQKIREGVTVSGEALYEPVFDALDDYLLALDAGLKVLVTERIALSVTHEFNRDTTPAEGVESDDRILKAGIIIEL